MIKINILLFYFLISFNLHAENRKPFPSGRYSALSGIKNLKVIKNQVINSSEEFLSVFFSSVSNFVNLDMKSSYLNLSTSETNVSSFLKVKGLLEVLDNDNKIPNLVLTNNLNRDISLINKKSLVIFIDNLQLKGIAYDFSRFKVLIYQADENRNFFLLKIR